MRQPFANSIVAPGGASTRGLAVCQRLVVLWSLTVFFASSASADSVLRVEQASGGRCQAVLELSESAGGLQFTLVGSSGLAFRGVESGETVAGSDWIVAWNAISDGELRVVIMGRQPGVFRSGSYRLLSWEVEAEEVSGTVSLWNVVLSDDRGRALRIDTRPFDWQRPPVADAGAEFKLLGNYPNPFNPSTVITFSLERTANVRLEVYDMLGRRLDVLVDETRAGGVHQVPWGAGNVRVATGIYLMRLTVGGRSVVGRMNVVQ